MKKLTKQDIEFLIKTLQDGKEIPPDYKYSLFPTIQKEYELVYAGKMRKEDLLANEDGVFPVPLQTEKVFNGNEYEAFKDGWKNMIVFGDNLQFLKTIYENKDPLIKDKVKGKVKLIYIDPPFATRSDFQGGQGQKAYTDKTKGSEFVEFLRRRLVLAKEILADGGSIFVHLDQKMCHQIRLILDEIFGVNNFQNQIIWQGTSAHNDAKNKFGNIHQVIYWYYKGSKPKYNFDEVRDAVSGANLKEYSRIEMEDGTVIPYKGNEHLVSEFNRRFRTVDATWKGKNKQFAWRGAKPNSKREWMYTHEEMEAALERGELYLSNPEKGAIRCLKRYLDQNDGLLLQDIWINAGRMSGGKGTYPTEKPEILLERILRSATDHDELVMDFFGGSGSFAATAEKLDRRWITCDLGKLAYYTMQKKILQIQDTKKLDEPNKKYGKKAKSFVTAQLGIYDLKKALDLEWQKYQEFVSGLFEVEIKKNKIAGFEFEGKKGDFPVKIFDYQTFKNSTINEKYLKGIHAVVGKKSSGRVYIIAPANFVDFLSNYHEIDGVKYYFLKIPYHVIKELHKTPFQKLRQPQSKKNVNDLEEAIGFHFIRHPEVKSEIKKDKDEVKILIKSFTSQELESDKTQDEKGMKNFETLSAVFVDKSYNGKAFEMDEAFFADELLPKKVNKKENDDEDIKTELKKIEKKGLEISFKKSEVGKQIMLIYTDIYGNDFTEIFTV